MAEIYYTVEQALQKAKSYCAYQERCHNEVNQKLIDFGIFKNERDQILAWLIEENYLNEERFAIQFAGGKFRVKQWGKIKIKYHLKQNFVSDYCIKKAISTILQNEYIQTLTKLFDSKCKSLKSEKNIFIKKKKVQNYLMQKGFEIELINELLNKLK